MPAIMTLADQYGVAVIEDCAQAHGARLAGRSVGSFGQIGAWSFCQDKIMTTGGKAVWSPRTIRPLVVDVVVQGPWQVL